MRGVDAVLEVINNTVLTPPSADDLASLTGTTASKKVQPPKPTCSTLEKAASKRAAQNGWIVQEYMERPLLVAGRKFDIRCYVVITYQKKVLKGYFYQDAYIRTSCK